MEFAKVLSINTDEFINKATRSIIREISPVIQGSIKNARQEMRAKDARTAGVATGRLFNKITISTYGKDSRGGKLEGRFISTKDMSLFIYRPTNKDLKILNMLEYGIDTPYIWRDKVEIRQWITDKLRNGGNIRFTKVPAWIKVGNTANSSFYGGGHSPIIMAKTKIMLDLERKLNISFNSNK